MKIVVGGQFNKKEIAKLINEIGGDQIEVTIESDLKAAQDLKNSKVDYYVGACETGSGGSLAMATAILGRDKTVSLATPGAIMSKDEIFQQVVDGKIAFGFTTPSINKVLNSLIPILISKNKEVE